MNSLSSVLALSLVVFLSEACNLPQLPALPPLIPPEYDCPIGGEKSKGVTCLGASNRLKQVESPNPIDCSKY